MARTKTRPIGRPKKYKNTERIELRVPGKGRTGLKGRLRAEAARRSKDTGEVITVTDLLIEAAEAMLAGDVR